MWGRSSFPSQTELGTSFSCSKSLPGFSFQKVTRLSPRAEPNKESGCSNLFPGEGTVWIHVSALHGDSHTGFPTVAKTSWTRTKGLTRFSSGFAFPAGQQQDLSGLDLQSRCGSNFKEEMESCVVKEDGRQSARSYLMCPICWMTRQALPAESKSCLSQLSHRKLIGVNDEFLKIAKNN